MDEECVYANVPVILKEYKPGFHVEEASRRRSKFPVGRVAVGGLILLLLAVVSALIGGIMFYNSSSKDTSEAKTQVTTVAEKETTQIFTTAAASTCSSVARCDDNWELHGTQCYYFSPTSLQLTWSSSKEKCESSSGNLLKIESSEEQGFVDGRARHLMVNLYDRFWIGLTDSATEGKWLWTDGSPLDQSLEFWTKNEHNTEPDNWKVDDEEGENCATMGEIRFPNGIKSWYDRSCKEKNRFICKKTATSACG